MPYPTPNLTTLQNQAIQDIQSADITDLAGNTITGLLQKAVLRVLALVQAGFAYLFFRFLDYVALQCTPFTSTGEYLRGWMALKGVIAIDASAATGTVQFQGTDGTPLPQGTNINRGDGVAYFTTEDASVSGTLVTASVQALVAGSAGTITPGSAASLASPITNINGAGTFTASTTPGVDQELDGALRTRGLRVYAAPPQGGSASDYVEWATTVAGVTRAWCLPNYNVVTAGAAAGVVSVLFMEDVSQAAFQGIPQGTNGVSSSETRTTGGSGAYPLATGDQLNVANSIFPLRPVTALVIAAAPSENVVDYVIGNLTPNTPAIQAAIEAALLDMHQRVGSPGGTTRPDGLPGGELYESDWDGAIASVPGVLAFDVSSPTGTLTSSTGAIPTVGTVTF